MPEFGFLRKVGQFINRTVNRVLGRADVVVQSERLVGLATADHLAPLAASLSEGTTTLPAWQAAMRSNIKSLYIDQYMIGRGGRGMMTQQDWGRVGAMLKDQYGYLDNYARDLSGMDVLEREAYIRNRSQLYANASNEAFERGRSAAARGLGFDTVNWNLTPVENRQTCLDRDAMGPQPVGPRGGFMDGGQEVWPADGTSICRCITSPESPVLTQRGWVPLLDIEVGDEVWTHKERWRPVLGLVVKPSSPGDQEIILRHPSGAVVSSTSGHLWWTAGGWVFASELSNIDSWLLMCYPYAREVTHEAMYPLRSEDEVRLQIQPLQIVQGNMSLRDAQRLEGRGVPVLRDVPQAQGSLGRSSGQPTNASWISQGRREATYSTGGLVETQVAGEARRTPLELVLAGGQRHEEDFVPIPVDVDHGERPDPGGACGPSHQPRCSGRPTGDPGTNGLGRPCQAPRSNSSRKQQQTDMDLRDMRDRVSAVQASGESGPQVLLGGVLPGSTAVYDLTVEEDHSFCIAGFWAHNTNDKCYLSYSNSETGQEWEA